MNQLYCLTLALMSPQPSFFSFSYDLFFIFFCLCLIRGGERVYNILVVFRDQGNIRVSLSCQQSIEFGLEILNIQFATSMDNAFNGRY